MYSPLKKHLYRAQQIIPSKNCATQKIIPSQAPLLPPYDYYRKTSINPPLEVFKNSHSLPQLRNFVQSPESLDCDNFYQLYDSPQELDKVRPVSYHRQEAPLPPLDTHTRPYTPPEKRYSSNFGKSNELKPRKPRPRSSCVYENAHMRDIYCVISNEKSGRGLNYTPNVRVSNFPMPDFNQMYIQNNFD